MKPKFQFSSLVSKKCTERLIEIIEQLGGSFIDSKTYSPKATHLVVEKLDCTEKILCFISAGKWIVTDAYLEDCSKENRFLSEENYHISKYFPKSKLALVSYEWREKVMRDKTKAPFHGWKVACMLDDEDKTQGITRIIQSGHGEAVKIKPNSRLCSKTGNFFTIVLYDEKLKNDAKVYAQANNLSYFPLQAIPDYLMQCTKHTKPILSTQYYENLTSNSFSKNRKTGGLHLKVKEANDNFIFATFENLLYFANVTSSNKLNLLNTEMENQFVNLWNNSAFNEALHLLTMIEPNKLPSENVMILLFEFILENSFSKTKKSFSFLPILGETNVHKILYSSVCAYLKHVLLNNPPNSFEVIRHYQKVFDNLFIDLRIKETIMKAHNVQGLIDVLHWMSIHDFLLMNISKEKNRFHHCILSIFKLSEDEIKLKLIKTLANEESNISSATYFKMVQILAVCHKYSTNSELYSKMLDLLKEKSWSTNDLMTASKSTAYKDSFKSIFNYLLMKQSSDN